MEGINELKRVVGEWIESKDWSQYQFSEAEFSELIAPLSAQMVKWSEDTNRVKFYAKWSDTETRWIVQKSTGKGESMTIK